MTDLPLRVVVDTQAIVKEGFGTSGAFRHLLREAADGRVELIVPELAILETVVALRRRLHKQRAALKDLPALLRGAGVTAELGIEQLQTLCEQRLRADLAAAGVTPTAAPAVDGDEMVRRVLARRKPTKALKYDDKGDERPDQPEGFRDQLLWALVREAAQSGPVAFVTGNTKDFIEPGTDSNGRAELHAHLVEDLDEAEHGLIGEVNLFLDVTTLVRECLQDEDTVADVERLLSDDAGAELRRLVTGLVDERGVRMDEFSPEDLVEGNIEEATLLTFFSDNVDIDVHDAYRESGDEDPRQYGINATLRGEGDVDWYVSVPTGGDIEAFGEHVENVEDGGGLLQWTDGRVPVLLSVYGRYEPSIQQWLDLSVDYASMPAEEMQRRSQLHSDEEFKRLQALGLEPSDEEIEEMAERHEQEHGSTRSRDSPWRPFKPRGDIVT